MVLLGESRATLNVLSISPRLVLLCTLSLIVAISGIYMVQADEVVVVVQPLSHLSGCVQLSQVARGDSIPFLMNVTYTSGLAAGQPMVNGTVQIHLATGAVLNAFYNTGNKLWAYRFDIPWDYPTGPLGYYVTVENAQFAVNMIWTPVNPYGFVVVVPTNLASSVQALGATGQEVSTATLGQTIRISAKVKLPLSGEGYATQISGRTVYVPGGGGLLNASLASTVQASVGRGIFNATSGDFSDYTASKVLLSYDTATGDWVGSYTFKQGDAPGIYQLGIFASDKSSPANTGYALSNAVALGLEKIVENRITSEVVPVWVYGVSGAAVAIAAASLVFTLVRTRRKPN